MYKRIILTFLWVILSLPAAAAPRCMTSSEIQAEALLRLHSELMVIAVTCQQGSAGEDLASAYATFTRDNIAALHDAEKVMIARYKKTGGVARLDTLRTQLANEAGLQAAKQSAPVFCAAQRDKVVALAAMPPEQVRQEAGKMMAASKGKRCR